MPGTVGQVRSQRLAASLGACGRCGSARGGLCSALLEAADLDGDAEGTGGDGGDGKPIYIYTYIHRSIYVILCLNIYVYLCINLHTSISISIYIRNLYLFIYKALTSFVCKWDTGYSDSTFDPNSDC